MSTITDSPPPGPATISASLESDAEWIIVPPALLFIQGAIVIYSRKNVYSSVAKRIPLFGSRFSHPINA